jgi:glyoxylase-like metal-dependent hydrolase (beta-lactamase superfamily II)
MKAWSTAWNVAEVPITDRSVEIVQIRRTGKGCLSYLVASGNDAAVIDPSVSATVYTQIADGHGWQIKHVIETHIHADHLSRARRLAEQTAAQLLLPVQQRVHFRFTPIRAGESIAIGRATLRVFATPGHTDESLSFLLNDAALFSGDTLFPNGVGRPDLHADARQARRKAAALFSSLIQLSALPRTALLLAAHASEPIAFDGRPIAATIGDIQSWLHEWLTNENAFVDRVTSHLPPAPANFATIIEFNEGGEWPAGAEGDLEAGANRCAVS